MQYCPCEQKKYYIDCCGKFLQKKMFPSTPEELMRSRYTAHVENNMEYIRETMREPALLNFNEKGRDRRSLKWLGLEVVKTYLDPIKKNIGYVEFIANYKINNINQKIHELSEFHLVNDRWYYVDGNLYS